jgi:hypothetical protein
MGRRADPARIFEAQRSGVRARLTGAGKDPTTADRWLDAWSIEAATRDLPKDGTFWDAAWDLVMAERAARRSGWLGAARSALEGGDDDRDHCNRGAHDAENARLARLPVCGTALEFSDEVDVAERDVRRRLADPFANLAVRPIDKRPRFRIRSSFERSRETRRRPGWPRGASPESVDRPDKAKAGPDGPALHPLDHRAFARNSPTLDHRSSHCRAT